MLRLSMLALLSGAVVLFSGVVGQEATSRAQDKKEAKKDDPPAKAKGVLPQNWGKIGLTDDQKQEIYKIQGKYNGEIEKLEAKIKELKGTRDKEMKAVLNADQKKKLDEILTGKDK
jgi:Spy/CpxP family protein refolding chaperone